MHINKKIRYYAKIYTKMSYSYTKKFNTQNELLMEHLMEFYEKNENANLKKMVNIINREKITNSEGREINVSLRIIDWFVTNYAKKNYTVYNISIPSEDKSREPEIVRFKVYDQYKLKLESYGKKRFDPFCRWDRIYIKYDEDKSLETTIGQLNFFKWAIKGEIIDYILDNYDEIENDMNRYNSKEEEEETGEQSENSIVLLPSKDSAKTRKKRKELSLSACKSFKKEEVRIIVKFN